MYLDIAGHGVATKFLYHVFGYSGVMVWLQNSYTMYLDIAGHGVATKFLYHVFGYSGVMVWLQNSFTMYLDLTWSCCGKKLFKPENCYD